MEEKCMSRTRSLSSCCNRLRESFRATKLQKVPRRSPRQDRKSDAEGVIMKLVSELKLFLHCSFALQNSCLSISMVHGALNIAIFTTRREAPGEIECKHIPKSRLCCDTSLWIYRLRTSVLCLSGFEQNGCWAYRERARFLI